MLRGPKPEKSYRKDSKEKAAEGRILKEGYYGSGS